MKNSGSSGSGGLYLSAGAALGPHATLTLQEMGLLTFTDTL
jgi:hypothetical protein